MLYSENLALQEKLERANRQQQVTARSNDDVVDGANASSCVVQQQQHAPSVKFQTQHSSTSSKVVGPWNMMEGLSRGVT